MRFHRATLPSPYDTGQWGIPGVPCPSTRTLSARLDGELDDERAAAVDAHVRGCPICDSDFRRLESLSGCLKGWDSRGQGILPPQRLASRILREVEAEAGVRQRRRVTEGRRTWAAAAAALLAIGAGAALGGLGAPTVAPARTAQVAPRGGTPVVVVCRPLLDLAPLYGSDVAPYETESVSERAARLAANSPVDLAALGDRETRDTFARAAALMDLEERLGESPWWRGDRALASFAVTEFDRSVRLRERMADFERRVIDTRTVVKGDAARFLPFSAAFPLPVSDAAEGAEIPFRDATAFVESLYRVEVGATDGSGGIVVRLLSGSAPASEGASALDLAEAV